MLSPINETRARLVPAGRMGTRAARFCVLALILLPSALLSRPAAGADSTAVALTTTVHLPKSKAQKDVASSFLALLEVHVSESPAITVVERMQLELALQELVVSRGLNADPRDTLQLGQLASANLILNAQFLPPDETGTQRMLIRIVEAKTGRIRGITAAPIDALTIDDAALQVARYLSSMIEAPDQAAVTVAVGAFESAGRFDRLRPLELGIRDMLTTGLVNVSRFQVLQRSDMKQLLRELDLIQAGLANRGDLPDTLPRRAAAYLVTGTFDEENSAGKHKVTVDGKIIHARSGETVHEFQFVAAPAKLPEALSRYALHIAGFLTKASELPPHTLRQPLGRNETRQLLNQVLADLYRFRRLTPIGHRPVSFRVPGIQPVLNQRQQALRTVVKADSLLGKHLLRKSIDRLESLLFIQPEQAVAEYALGYCYAFHIEDIWQPDRSEVLLRKAFDRDPAGELGASALLCYADMSYHHRSGTLEPELAANAAKQVRFAFEHMPPKHRTYHWARMLELLNRLDGQRKDFESMADTLDVVLAMIDHVDDAWVRRKITLAVGGLAIPLCLAADASPAQQETARKLLATWAESENKIRRHTGSLGLAKIASSEKDYEAAAGWYQRAAETYVTSAAIPERHARENLLTHAARHLRLANKPSDAVRLLESFDPSWSPTSLNRGYRDVELGICLELLGEQDKALRIWVTAAEEVPGLVNNSDVVRRISALGGVPVREDRDIDVRYVTGAGKRPVFCRALATDGSRLFCDSGYQGKDVLSYDVSTDTWKTIGKDIGHVTCLAYGDGAVWVGTDRHGLWRCRLVGSEWQQWSSEQGLPDQHVESLAVYGQTAYVGVGTAASGGLVRVDAKDQIHIFESPGAPQAAPTHVIAIDGGILARTLTSFYEYNTKDGTWKPLTKLKSRWNPSIHQGKSTIWASRYGNELYEFDKSGKINDEYKQTWFPRGQGKAGYLLKFLIERDGQIWFGGNPWARFKSCGLYRLDKLTGDFVIYGPRDGFKTSITYETLDGVWAADRLWLATSGGLAEVTPRKTGDDPRAVD